MAYISVLMCRTNSGACAGLLTWGVDRGRGIGLFADEYSGQTRIRGGG